MTKVPPRNNHKAGSSSSCAGDTAAVIFLARTNSTGPLPAKKVLRLTKADTGTLKLPDLLPRKYASWYASSWVATGTHPQNGVENGARAVYTAAIKEVADAQSLYEIQEDQVGNIQQNIRAGTDDRLSLDAAQIQISLLAQFQLDALTRAQQAFGHLEDSLQRPLAPDEIVPIAPGTPALMAVSGETSR